LEILQSIHPNEGNALTHYRGGGLSPSALKRYRGWGLSPRWKGNLRLKVGGLMEMKHRKLYSPFYVFFVVAILLWVKTSLTQFGEFNLEINNLTQAFLLIFNPIGAILLLLGISLLGKDKAFYKGLITIQFLLSLILYANVLYYRFYSDFITLPTLFQTKNFSDLGGSILALSKPYDPLFFIDTFFLLVLISTNFYIRTSTFFTRKKILMIYSLSIILICLTVITAETDRPQLLKRMFDRNYIVKYLGMYNYIFYDVYQSTKSTTQRVVADSDDVTEIIHYTKSIFAEPNPKYFGVGKGLNVIYIHLESLQNFVIDYELYGEKVTPFLHSLKKDPHTFYFDNFFHQTAQGKTSDAEFIIDNSLFGLPQGAVFTTKGLNTYQAAPAILGQHGYTSAVFHGNNKTFWNRDVIYKSFGYRYFFDSSYYDMTPSNVVNYGLKDKPFFQQSIQLLQSLPQPFYTKFITLSNHYPYPITEEEATIAPFTSGDTTVDTYFQTARYLDEAIKEFFYELDSIGLLERSIVILYGDHYGISKNHKRAMKQVLGEEITSFKQAQLQRVPLYIRVPNIKGEVRHDFSGQIDLLPTLLHLLGIQTKEYLLFGTDIFSSHHDELVVFRNGNFVNPIITKVNNNFFDTTNGMKLIDNGIGEEHEQIAKHKLELSDRLVNRDLLRFYTPPGFTPVNRHLYDYRRVIED
jgi:lipoteichoic acid synthase